MIAKIFKVLFCIGYEAALLCLGFWMLLGAGFCRVPVSTTYGVLLIIIFFCCFLPYLIMNKFGYIKAVLICAAVVALSCVGRNVCEPLIVNYYRTHFSSERWQKSKELRYLMAEDIVTEGKTTDEIIAMLGTPANECDAEEFRKKYPILCKHDGGEYYTLETNMYDRVYVYDCGGDGWSFDYYIIPFNSSDGTAGAGALCYYND